MQINSELFICQLKHFKTDPMIAHAQLNEHRQSTYEKIFFKQMKTGHGL